jgi:hypothetical protein
VNRAALALVFIAGCGASAAGGFWIGMREAAALGTEAEYLPRGAAAAQHLDALRAGRTQKVLTALEFEVDSGLVWGQGFLQHPMRRLFGVYPDYETYATRMANYRLKHPSPVAGGAFEGQQAERQNPELHGELGRSAQQARETIRGMVERYASRPR